MAEASFEQLPLELLQQIFGQMDLDSLHAFRLCSKRLREVADSPIIWQDRLIAPVRDHIKNPSVWELLARRGVRKLYLLDSHTGRRVEDYSLVLERLKESLCVIYASSTLLNERHKDRYAKIDMPRVEELVMHCGTGYSHRFDHFRMFAHFPHVKRLSFIEIPSYQIKNFIISGLPEVKDNLECIRFGQTVLEDPPSVKSWTRLFSQFRSCPRLKSFTFDVDTRDVYFFEYFDHQTKTFHGDIISSLYSSNKESCLSRLCLRAWSTVSLLSHPPHVYTSVRVLVLSQGYVEESFVHALSHLPSLQSLALQVGSTYYAKSSIPVRCPALQELVVAEYVHAFFGNRTPCNQWPDAISVIDAPLLRLWCDVEISHESADLITQLWPTLQIVVLSKGIKEKDRASSLQRLAELPSLRHVYEIGHIRVPGEQKSALGSKYRYVFVENMESLKVIHLFFTAQPEQSFDRIFPRSVIAEFTCMANDA